MVTDCTNKNHKKKLTNISSLAQMKEGKEIPLIVLDKNTREFLGYVSIHEADSKTPEFGIWLKKEAHGFGYGYEALSLLKNWSEQNLNYDYLKYPVYKKNLPSRKLAEKLGGIIKEIIFS